MRLYPENVKTLYEETLVNTPVVIVNQPYLIGQRDGVLYLEAHTPLEGSGALELEKIYARLRKSKRNRRAPLTGQKSRKYRPRPEEYLFQLSEVGPVREQEAVKIIEVEHPDNMYGRPDIPGTETGRLVCFGC